ncbi:MAG: PAS domain S-box protein [Candidatus Marinimicrobia bacterium]|jgi:PAS domain S-box-containing protein|nr:PAS domain S-box protein [Candidatus Neomarinimicrobiota bacterium]MBT3633051.1 PAS domain S-box protein [Candidatus Neomarinimicrobiota bacterium]MBT3683507.1 PAS domain S-box protein [Candidatus Neomarinimicrobiota bacterium]MBT3758651.1 PAS domain S-box protein [Candidatus Neomarinimicrobiota bacterium]MBT3896440.1 PAS domain S-box protein [Candidatus Neomarinimicrobiota bacterium]
MSKSNILIVEDERITAEHIKQYLESLEYRIVEIAATGDQAIKAIHQHDVHLVIMDIKLKGEMDGIKTAQQIQELQDVPIIFLTAFADDFILEKAKISDPFGYVLKPFGQKELKIAVTMALYKHGITSQLKENEGRYRSLVEASPNSIFIHQDGKIIYANPAACEMGGATSPEDIIGSKVINHIHPDYIEFAKVRMTKMLKSGKPSSPADEKFIRLDGRVIDVRVTAIPFEWNKKPAIQVISRDITKDIRLQRQEKAIRKISEAVHSTESLPQLYQKIHSSISDFMYTENLFIALYNEDKKTLEFPYSVDSRDKFPSKHPFGDGLTEYVIKNRSTLFVTKKEIEYMSNNNDLTVIGSIPEEWIGIPLTHDQGILGVIAIQNYNDVKVFTENDVEMLQFISHQIARAIKYKQAVDYLTESENKFRILSESSSFAIFVYQRGRFKYVNPALSQISGYTKDELLEMDVWSMVHPDYRDIVARGMSRRKGTTLVPKYDFKVITKDGGERWCDFTAAIVDFEGDEAGLVTLVDITKRKKSEKDLIRLNQAVKNTHDVIYMTDYDGIFTFVNPQFELQYGYTADEIIGKATPDIISEEKSGKNFYRDLWKTILKRKNMTLEVSKIAKSGKVLTVEESIDPIYENEKIVGYLSIQRNISEKKMLESTFRELGTSFTKLSGKEFYEKVSWQLAQSIGIDHVYIGHFRKNGTEVQVLGGYSNGVVMDLFNYEILDTPCEGVLEHKVVNIPSNLSSLYINKIMSEHFNAEAYVGSPLFNILGEPLGIIVLLNETPIKNESFAEIMLRAFSDRVVAEIERWKTEKDLKNKINTLARHNKAMIGRELKMIDLKKEINLLLKSQGEPTKYNVTEGK